MRALLKIPFAMKDGAKQIAKNNRAALFFEPVSKNWEFRGNTMPAELEPYIVEVLEDFKVQTRRTVLEPPPENINRGAQSINSGSPKSVLPMNYIHVVDMPFSIRNRIAEFGGYYDPQFKTYLVKSGTIHASLKPYLSRPYSYEAWIEKFLNHGFLREGITSQYAQKAELTPRDYQVAAHKVAMKAYEGDLGGFLLADEVGLGKTISAGVVAQEKEFETILVVTTLAAVAHWRKTFLKMVLPGKEIIIINYDRLQKLFKPNDGAYKKKAATKKTKNKRLANKGEAPAFDLVIWDEAHKMKNNTAMRSRLGQKITQNANFNLWLSATAGQNPLELSYLAPLLAKITGQTVESMEEFEKWCKGMDLGVTRGDFGKWLWDQSQESIDKIHTLLFKGKPQAALRRTPVDIAGYPEINRELTPLELEPDEQEAYELSWNEFRNFMLEQQRKKSRAQKGDDNILVMQLRLRQKASLLKIPYTIEYIENLLEKGHQVAVSVGFKESMFKIEEILAKSGISCTKIYGGQGEVEKENERVNFQKGVNKVALFTVEEAISLHQGEYNDVPRSMLIHDLRWSAISMSQIEGRTHRDGKFSQIYWLYFTDTIEEDIAKIVLRRVISMKGMIGDDTKVLKEIEEVLLSKV